jgi:iron(III) transport system permease protein
MYTFPIAYLMLSDILNYEDTSVYDAAVVLGIPKWKQFLNITLPYLRKPLIAVFSATFTAIITDYGVPLMVGGQHTTLPVMMYHEVIGRLNFGRGSVIGAILLLPAIISFIIDTLNKNTENQSFITQSWRSKKNTAATIFSTAYCSFVSIAVLLPILSFIILTVVQRYPIDMTLTLTNIIRANNQGAGRFLMNSLYISVMVTGIGVFTSYISAYITARSGGKLSRVMHLLTLTTLAIPGVVLGISYALFFRGSPVSGTFTILILANIVHFFASPYLIAYNSLGKLNPNLEAVSMTLGVRRSRALLDIILPQTWRSIAEMSLYYFVNSMMTISAVSFLNTARTRPISMMIPMFEGQMQIESAAVVSLAILIVNILMKGVVGIAKKRAPN